MQAEAETYNGWKNYATWGVALVLDNEEVTYNACTNEAARLWAERHEIRQVEEGIWEADKAPGYILADWLKDLTERECGLGDLYGPSLMAQQVIQAGLAEVDWDEVANHYLSEFSNA